MRDWILDRFSCLCGYEVLAEKKIIVEVYVLVFSDYSEGSDGLTLGHK